MTAVTASTSTRNVPRGLGLPGKLVLASLAAVSAAGAWMLLDGPRKGVCVGVACLLVGAILLGPKFMEYVGLILVIVGGLVAGVSLLLLLVVAPVVDRAEQAINHAEQVVHDLTHPSISAPKVDVGGAAKSAVDKARDAATGLTGGTP